MKKKGVELPQNVIIIAIIILVVLVVLIAFFVGGSGTVFSRFSDLFSASADDESTAIAFCQQYCQTAQGQEASLQRTSNYCTKWFKLDRVNNADNTKGSDGKIDKDSTGKNIKRYYCSNEHTPIDDADSIGVGVSCAVTC